jgi:hypothetical protein
MRRYRVIARFGLVAMGVALCIAGGVAGASAMYGNGSAAPKVQVDTARSAAPRTALANAPAHQAVAPVMTSASVPTPVAVAASVPAATQHASDTTATPSTASPSTVSVALQGTAAPAPVPVTLAPIVPDGRSDLRDSIYVVRLGDTVRVYFDTPDARTRRADKFEMVVRSTLPAVYGLPVDSALSALAVGRLTREGDLLTDLPTRGVRVALASGAVVTLWPETRPGRDGPLVVAYRSVITR